MFVMTLHAHTDSDCQTVQIDITLNLSALHEFLGPRNIDLEFLMDLLIVYEQRMLLKI